MTATLYPLYKVDILKATTTNLDLDQTTSNIAPYGVLIDTGTYTYSAAHQFFSSLSGIVGDAQGKQITTPTVVASANTAVFDGDDLTFVAVSGATVEGIAVYRQNAGANTTWSLVSFYDTAGGGLPVTPNGGNITVTWNASGIFSLSDARAKHEIRQIGAFGPLGLYQYRYRRPGAPLEVGFIAQEVLKHFPRAVCRFQGLLHVDYGATLESVYA